MINHHQAPAPLPWFPGRLAACYSKWKIIGASATVISWVLMGFCLPFIAEPSTYCFPNHPSAFTYAAAVTAGVAELVATGAAPAMGLSSFLHFCTGLRPEGRLRYEISAHPRPPPAETGS